MHLLQVPSAAVVGTGVVHVSQSVKLEHYRSAALEPTSNPHSSDAHAVTQDFLSADKYFELPHLVHFPSAADVGAAVRQITQFSKVEHFKLSPEEPVSNPQVYAAQLVTQDF